MRAATRPHLYLYPARVVPGTGLANRGAQAAAGVPNRVTGARAASASATGDSALQP